MHSDVFQLLALFWDDASQDHPYSIQNLVAAGKKYASSSKEFQSIIQSLNGWGDAFTRTIKQYTPKAQTLTEEINRNTGVPQGAADLTWSYAALLTSAFARADLKGDKGYAATLANFGVQANK